MFRSIFLRRILLMVLVSLVVSGVFSAALFFLASIRSVSDRAIDESIRRANLLSDYFSRYPEEMHSVTNNESEFLLDESFSGSYVLIYDKNAILLRQTSEIDSKDTEILAPVKNHAIDNLLTRQPGASLFDIIPNRGVFDQIIVVQIPIVSKGTMIGYVIVGTPTRDSSEMLTDFVQIMLLSTFVASLAMLMPVYFGTMRLVRPLRKVNEVARAMGQGDFSMRADPSVRGEVGELAQSFNDLAERLSRSITDLTRERNRLREIFDVISEGIVSVDTELRTVYSNPAISTLFENASSRNLFTERLQVIPFEEVWDDFTKCVSEGTTVERTIEDKDNAYLSTIVPTFDNEGKIAGATGFFRDISESERLEQTRRDYVANVSHELRTPLTALRGLVEPLADGMVKNEKDRTRYYGIILHETMRLSRLIDDMLELSRLQARTLAFKTFPFDLNVLLSEIETKFKPVMKEAHLSFRVEYKTGVLPTVMGNPDRVEQILVILMDNAKKYTAGGGSITISTEYSEETDKVMVSVIDTGQGIHEYDIDHIFDRFYKADRARGKKGTGLGLSIAKELLSYMGETISVSSIYGEGTTFMFTLTRVRGTMWY
ncbi:MAG: cell wall metabolism sensor histidine kinase WalK [Clostridiaceae bacterium]|nr:cell wall metabolism sensor histidine kinase WalK [Clostridiaceae bacterium]